MATIKLKQMYNNNHNTYNTYKRQQHILININHKLATANAMITLADKSKATVIIYKHEYDKKVQTFFTDNNFHTLPENPTNKDQTQILKTIKKCNQIIPKQHIKYLTPPPPNTKRTSKTPQTQSPHPTGCKQQNRTLTQTRQKTQ
jgi:ABC-type Fe3+ transport system substrate-binding protein